MKGASRWLPVGRILVLLFSVLVIGFWAAGVVVHLQEPVTDCLDATCDPASFYAGDLRVIESMGLNSDNFQGIVFRTIETVPFGLLYFAVAAVIFWKKSDEWIGLFVAMTLVILGGLIFTSTDFTLVRAYPAIGPFRDILTLIGLIPLYLLFLFFPDGRFVPYRLRWVTILILGAFIFVIIQHSGSESEYILDTLLMSLSVPFLLYAQVYRYRYISTPAERQQTKWAVIGLAGGLAMLISWSLLGLFYPPEQPGIERVYVLLIAGPVMIGFSLLPPLGFAFSIFRYRLWDIDILIRRTLSYAVLTAILAGTYFGGVVVLQSLFAALSAETSSPLITVISTLAIAGLFNPLRTRIQDFIDRRFYRAKYDSAQALEGFSNTARDEVDMDRLAVALLDVVDATVRPERTSLWLKGQE